jgi:DNA polymerase III alpha subunit
VRSGALDSISDGYTRPQLFFRYHNMAGEDGLGFLPPAPPLIGDYPPRVKLVDEVRTLGIVVSRHPLALFRSRIARIAQAHRLAPVIQSPDIPAFRGRRVWIAGILVTGKEVATKTREPMIFVSFEDETSVFETVLFPEAFKKYYPLLDDGWAFLVFGRVEDDLGALAISVERLVRVSRQAAGAGFGATAVVPARPPVFMWSREHAVG